MKYFALALILVWLQFAVSPAVGANLKIPATSTEMGRELHFVDGFPSALGHAAVSKNNRGNQRNIEVFNLPVCLIWDDEINYRKVVLEISGGGYGVYDGNRIVFRDSIHTGSMEISHCFDCNGGFYILKNAYFRTMVGDAEENTETIINAGIEFAKFRGDRYQERPLGFNGVVQIFFGSLGGLIAEENRKNHPQQTSASYAGGPFSPVCSGVGCIRRLPLGAKIGPAIIFALLAWSLFVLTLNPVEGGPRWKGITLGVATAVCFCGFFIYWMGVVGSR